MKHKYSDHFFTKIKQVHSNRYDYSETVYNGSDHPVTIRCRLHGYFTQKAAKHAEGQGCPQCGINSMSDKKRGRISPKRKTQDQFINEVKSIHGDALDLSNVVYENNHKDVIIGCAINPEHGFFKKTPISLIHKKRGCPYCTEGFYPKQTAVEFLERSNEIHNHHYEYDLKDATHIGANDVVVVICPEHGEFKQSASRHYNGAKCPKCVGGVAKDFKYYLERFKQTHGDKYQYVENTFTNSFTPMTIICPEHGEFEQRPFAHYSGDGCSKCGKQVSLAETQIYDYVESLVSGWEQSNRTLINPLELDMVHHDLKIAIEYDGLRWHSEHFGNKSKKYHQNKTNLCEEQGYRLIHIFEDEWINKRDIVKSRLSHLLGKSPKGVGARKLVIKDIEWKEAKVFIDKYHIQGAGNAGFCKLGAFFNDVLVGVMVFGKARTALGSSKKDHVELLRFCSDGKTYAGMASKLFNYFIKNYSPHHIISFADRRYSTINGLYSSLGFSLVDKTQPNYWYFKNSSIERKHRYNFRKHVVVNKLGGDPRMTEWENMINLGYDRIYDCGSLKYDWSSDQ